MSTLDRYIFRNLLISLGVSTAALLGLLWLINSLKFLDWFVNKGLSVWTFLKITWMLMPGFLTVFLPIALFAVALFVYSRMTVDRELVVMRSSGLSSWRLAVPALWLCGAMTLFGYALTLGVVPRLEAAFDEIRSQIRDDITSMVLRDGQFNQIDRNITVYLGERQSDGSLKNLIIYDTSTPGRSTTILAEAGALIADDGPARFVLLNGNRQEWTHATQRASFLFFDSYSLVFREKTSEGGGFRSKRINQLPFRDLVTLQVGDLPESSFTAPLNKGQVRRMRLEAHQRLLHPLNHVGFVLIALGAVLSSSFHRRANSRPALLAVALVVVFQALNLGAGSLAKQSSLGLVLFDLAVFLPILVGALWLSDAPGKLANLHAARRQRDQGPYPPVLETPTP